MMLLLVAQLLVTQPAQLELHYMPTGTDLQLELGGKKERVRYFTFEEYKLLLKLDGDLFDAHRTIDIYKDIDLKYAGIVKQKDEIIATLQADKVTLTERSKRLEEKWHKAEEDLVDAAGGPWWTYVIGIGGGVALIVGGVLIAVGSAQQAQN
jgi:hypothetical protein